MAEADASESSSAVARRWRRDMESSAEAAMRAEQELGVPGFHWLAVYRI